MNGGDLTVSSFSDDCPGCEAENSLAIYCTKCEAKPFLVIEPSEPEHDDWKDSTPVKCFNCNNKPKIMVSDKDWRGVFMIKCECGSIVCGQSYIEVSEGWERLNIAKKVISENEKMIDGLPKRLKTSKDLKPPTLAV